MTLLDRQTDLPGWKLPPEGKLSEEEFVAWCDEDTRAEWVEGSVVMMPPVNLQHGGIHSFLSCVLGLFVSRRRAGQVFVTRVHVRLHAALRRSPDLFYIARENAGIIKEQVIDGAPDLFVEIVSPGSSSRDYREKYLEYQAAGVREYWIVDPLAEAFEAHTLVNGAYTPNPPVDGKVMSVALPGFYLCPAWLWSDPMAEAYDCLTEILASQPAP